MPDISFIFGGLFGALAILLGAFGSHYLKKKWTPELLQSFEIGIRYQMYHALFLILLGAFNKIGSIASIFTIVGVFLFSGSIYGICVVKSKNKPVKLLGPLTPIGGLCLLIGWIVFIFEMI